MIHSRILIFSLCITFSFQPLLLVPTEAVPTLPCYSSFQFVPGNYSTCVPLKYNSTLAWSLKWDPVDSKHKYFSGLFTSIATKPGGWIAVGFNLNDAPYSMFNAAIFACYNSENGPIMHQLYTDQNLGYTVRIDMTKSRLNVTDKRCSIETINVGGTTIERIYMQFNITFGSKAKYVNQYAKGTCTALGQGYGGTAMNQHSWRWTDNDLRDFRNTSFPGLVEPPRQPSVQPPPPNPLPPNPPPPKSPPPSSPPRNPPPLKHPPLNPPPRNHPPLNPPRNHPPLNPPPILYPPPKARIPPPKKKSPPPPKARIPPLKKKSPPPPKARIPPPQKKSPPPPKAPIPPPQKKIPPPPKARIPPPQKKPPPPNARIPPPRKSRPPPPKVPTLPCYSSFRFVPGKYSTCVPLDYNSTLAWSLKWDPVDSKHKYFSGLFTSIATEPGGWIAVGFNLNDETYEMFNAAIFSCYNSVKGPIMHQLYTDEDLGYTVQIDTTKSRLNVTGKRCSIETINVGGTTIERIYMQFNVTFGSKAKYVNQYAKGSCTALGQGYGGTAMEQHWIRWTDDDLRDFRNTTFPGRVEPPRQRSIRYPPPKSTNPHHPPPKARIPPPKGTKA